MDTFGEMFEFSGDAKVWIDFGLGLLLSIELNRLAGSDARM